MAKPGITRKPSVQRHNCGTNQGYAAHLRYDETTCRPCRDAHSAYGADSTAARERAYRRLAAEYVERFHDLYEEELNLRGIKQQHEIAPPRGYAQTKKGES